MGRERLCRVMLPVGFLIVSVFGIPFFSHSVTVGYASEMLAAVGGEPFTRQDLEERLKSLPPSLREQYETPEGQNHLVRELVRIEVFAREGESLGLNQSESFKKKILAVTKALLAEEYSRKNVLEGITVGTEEARQYYSDHRDLFRTPEKINAPSIFIALPADSSPEQMALKERKANDAAAMLRTGEEFRKVEALFSERNYVEDGEYFARGRLEPDIEAAVFQLQVGEVSEVLKVNGGLLIFRMEDKIPEQAAPYDEVETEIRERLLAAKRLERFEETERRLFEKYHVTFADSENLGSNEKDDGKILEEKTVIVGKIVQIVEADRRLRKKGQLGSVLLEEKAGSTTYGKASFTVTSQTGLREERASGRKSLAFNQLKVGQWVAVTPVGPMAPSYPAQGNAAKLLVLAKPPR